MNDSPAFLAFDLGAESGRALLGQLADERLRLTEMHRFENKPVRVRHGWSERRGSTLHWDALRLWRDIQLGLRKTASEHNLISLGIDTWGVDFGLLDRDGALLGNPVHYRDDRTDGVMEATFGRVPRAEIFEQTGIQFLPFNTLYQLLALVQQKSPALDMAERLLFVPDLFNYWLTGRAVNEQTIASTSQFYDPRAGGWAAELLNAFELPTHLLGEIVPAGTILGELLPSVAADFDIRASDKAPQIIAPACHDSGSAVVAVPAVAGNGESDFAWISSGTWSIMGVELAAPLINEEALRYNFSNEGGVYGTTRLLRNMAGLWPVQQSLQTWRRAGRTFTYDDLTEMARQATPLRTLIDPDDPTFAKPGDMPARIAEYCVRVGQPVPENEGQMIRCVLEGLALKYRWVLERLESLLGKRLDPIHIVGGGTQNRLLSQLTADATGRTVVAGPVEATAIGNLLVQMIATGHLGSLAEARELVSRSFKTETFAPSSERGAWDAAYGRLEELVEDGGQ